MLEKFKRLQGEPEGRKTIEWVLVVAILLVAVIGGVMLLEVSADAAKSSPPVGTESTTP